MNRHVYNFSLISGWALVSSGVGMVHLPSGLIVAGSLLLVLTLYGARLAAKARSAD
jgi:hypothetical protein